MKHTIWVRHPEFNRYLISIDGVVRTLKYIDTLGRVKTPKVVKSTVRSDGYLSVSLSNKGTYKRDFVHRLVGLHLPRSCRNRIEINHKDGDKSNNTLENLEWATRSENARHMHRTGLHPICRNQYSKEL